MGQSRETWLRNRDNFSKAQVISVSHPRISEPLGARSAEQTILETASKIVLAIFVEEWGI